MIIREKNILIFIRFLVTTILLLFVISCRTLVPQDIPDNDPILRENNGQTQIDIFTYNIKAIFDKDKITVGNINTSRDYSWITEVTKAIILSTKLPSKDFIISAGRKISGKEILTAAYKLNKLDFRKYYSVSKKFYRKKLEKR